MSLLGFHYLQVERQLDNETIRKFHLGYCDKDRNIYADMDAPYKSLELDYKFQNSALFPIFNLYGDLIGVSARKLDYKSNLDLKYVNTVYPKTDHVYGLSLTLPDCVKANRAYVVEGNIDTAMMYQHGFRNVVGMLGSNLSITQLTILSRFVDEIYLVPDGDTAGEKLIERLMGDGRKKGLVNKFPQLTTQFYQVKLPAYFDPDKFLREKGHDEFQKLEVIKLNKHEIGGVRT